MRTTHLATLGLVPLLVVGCTRGQQGAGRTSSLLAEINQVKPPATLKPTATPKLRGESPALAVASQNTFGLRLGRRLLGQHPRANLLFSPLSAWQCGAMVQMGAGGDAKAGLRQALSIATTVSDSKLNASTLELRNALQSQNAKQGVELNVANALCVAQQTHLVPAFSQACRSYLGATTENLDFGSPAATQRINDWVAAQTKGKITQLVRPGDLTPTTAVCLTNAVYFHGQWETPFEAKATHSKPFHCADGTQQSTPLMSLPGIEDAYLSSDVYEGVRLRYANSTCALVALLPRRGRTPADVLRRFNPAQLHKQFGDDRVNLQLPRFKMVYNRELSPDLQALGATPAFAADADFRPMFGDVGSISVVRHQAVLEVDEKGTTAAATTEMEMQKAARVAPKIIDLTFDRPFIVALMEGKNGALLMLGVVNAPQRL